MNLDNKIVIYQTEDGQTQIDVRMENETVWLTQAQMAELFQTDRTSIVRHINNIYKDVKLDDKKFEVLQKLLDKLNATGREILSGLRVIKSFNKEKYFKKS